MILRFLDDSEVIRNVDAKHRETCKRLGGCYPSDLTDEEWALLKPLIPPAKPGGRPRHTDMHEAMNAILYLLRTGCPWCYLPRDGFPPRPTVYNIFRKLGIPFTPSGYGDIDEGWMRDG